MHHTRVLRPSEGVYAFYDGRIEGYRFAQEANWVDEGALSVGIASYAIVSGEEAVVYDTHATIEHARFVRSTLEGEGSSEAHGRPQSLAPRPCRRHGDLQRLRGDLIRSHRRAAGAIHGRRSRAASSRGRHPSIP